MKKRILEHHWPSDLGGPPPNAAASSLIRDVRYTVTSRNVTPAKGLKTPFFAANENPNSGKDKVKEISLPNVAANNNEGRGSGEGKRLTEALGSPPDQRRGYSDTDSGEHEVVTSLVKEGNDPFQDLPDTHPSTSHNVLRASSCLQQFLENGNEQALSELTKMVDRLEEEGNESEKISVLEACAEVTRDLFKRKLPDSRDYDPIAEAQAEAIVMAVGKEVEEVYDEEYQNNTNEFMIEARGHEGAIQHIETALGNTMSTLAETENTWLEFGPGNGLQTAEVLGALKDKLNIARVIAIEGVRSAAENALVNISKVIPDTDVRHGNFLDEVSNVKREIDQKIAKGEVVNPHIGYGFSCFHYKHHLEMQPFHSEVCDIVRTTRGLYLGYSKDERPDNSALTGIVFREANGGGRSIVMEKRNRLLRRGQSRNKWGEDLERASDNDLRIIHISDVDVKDYDKKGNTRFIGFAGQSKSNPYTH